MSYSAVGLVLKLFSPFRISLIGFAIFLVAAPLMASSPESDDDFDWFEEEFAKLAREVNEGELRFLPEPPQKSFHHHHNEITLLASSLTDGWVQLRQCHYNIGNVGAAQILFREGGIRNLRVTQADNIEKAWVEGNTVQVVINEEESALCIAAESMALTPADDGIYLLNNGPFLRRFLDGYYPMRVTMQVLYANSGLSFDKISPPGQPGFEVGFTSDSINFEAWFEGELRTEIELKSAGESLAECSGAEEPPVTVTLNC